MNFKLTNVKDVLQFIVQFICRNTLETGAWCIFFTFEILHKVQVHPIAQRKGSTFWEICRFSN